MSNDNMRILTELARSGRVDRRGFMTGALALGVTVGAASALWSRSAAAQPKKGGTLRVGMGHGSTTDSLDPSTFENGFTLAYDYCLYNHIGEVNADGGIEPELAESWEASPDARVWTFKLRPGVTFHNGKDLTADDVVASVNFHRGEDTKSPAKSLLTDVVSIKADGKDTVVVELTSGNADFPYTISDYHIAILPSAEGKVVDPNAGVGTGPYSLAEYEAGVRFRGTRNPNYFKSDKAHVDEILLLSIIDAAARSNALQTGEIDAMDRVDLKTVGLMGRNKDLNIVETVGFRHYTFPMRCDMAPFDNVDVRLALKYALNREEMVQKILHGFGSMGNDHPISPANLYHADLEQRSYDPDKAKFHLKKAGMENLRVDLSAADAAFPGAVDAATLYKEHAAPAGIDINVIREPNDGYWSNVWMNKGWCACYWGGRATEDAMFTTAYTSGADWNDTFWSNEKFDKLLVAARAELDKAKRAEMYREMQLLVRDDGGVVVPMFAHYVQALHKRIGTPEKWAGNWDLDGMKFAERWWLT